MVQMDSGCVASLHHPCYYACMSKPERVEPVVVWLNKAQKEEGLGSNAFARKLGINAGHWSKVRRGEESMGRKLLEAALRLYPELSYVHARSLQKDSTEDVSIQRQAVA